MRRLLITFFEKLYESNFQIFRPFARVKIRKKILTNFGVCFHSSDNAILMQNYLKNETKASDTRPEFLTKRWMYHVKFTLDAGNREMPIFKCYFFYNL